MAGLVDVMREVIDRAGGRMAEEEYLFAVRDLSKTMMGTEPKWTSLRSNAKNSKRMEKAGLTNVIVGKTREVWLQDKADGILDGEVNTSCGQFVVQQGDEADSSAPVVSYMGGTWQGIPRRDPAQYDDTTQALIPRRYGFVETNQSELKLMAAAFMDGEHLLMEGAKGSGKTIAAYDFCHNLNLPALRVSCSDGLNEETFVGYRTRNKEGELVWVDGALIRAMKLGMILILDELNAAHPSVLISLHAALDFGHVVVTEDDSALISAHPDFRVIACINPPDDYAGVNEMNQATEDRFAYHPIFEYLKPLIEARVIQEQCGLENQELADQLVKMATDLREMKKNRMIQTDTSTRTLIQTLRAAERLNLKQAVDLCFVNKYKPEEREDVKGVARAVLEDYR